YVLRFQRDEGEGRVVEADVDCDERRTRVLRVELDHRRHVDPAEIVDTAGDADRDVGRAFAGVDLHVEPGILVVALRLRNKERGVSALDDPVHHYFDVFFLGRLGTHLDGESEENYCGKREGTLDTRAD